MVIIITVACLIQTCFIDSVQILCSQLYYFLYQIHFELFAYYNISKYIKFIKTLLYLLFLLTDKVYVYYNLAT